MKMKWLGIAMFATLVGLPAPASVTASPLAIIDLPQPMALLCPPTQPNKAVRPRNPNAAGAKNRETAVLPQSFKGWKRKASTANTDIETDLVEAGDLDIAREYGFTGLETATYSRADRTVQVRVFRFKDATGAYGAFTYYMQAGQKTLPIPDMAILQAEHILFFRGNLLLNVMPGGMAGASTQDLVALSNALPLPKGNDLSSLPTLPGNLPQQSLVTGSTKYVVGPVTLERVGLPFSAALVDFSKSPEIVMGKYRSSTGEAGVTLIAYPTPKIAGDRMRTMQSASLPGGPFYFKRAGSIVAVVSGVIPATEAQALLSSINYEAQVTWDQSSKHVAHAIIPRFFLALFTLTGFALLVALILGFVYGGIRVLASKLFPGRIFDRPESVEIIRLNLK